MKAIIDEAMPKDFVPNWAYELTLDFNHGKISYLHIHKCRPKESGMHHYLDVKNGSWTECDRPIAFNTQHLFSGSHGCRGTRIWLISGSFDGFKIDVRNGILSILDTYLNQINSEIKQSIKATELIHELQSELK